MKSNGFKMIVFASITVMERGVSGLLLLPSEKKGQFNRVGQFHVIPAGQSLPERPAVEYLSSSTEIVDDKFFLSRTKQQEIVQSTLSQLFDTIIQPSAIGPPHFPVRCTRLSRRRVVIAPSPDASLYLPTRRRQTVPLSFITASLHASPTASSFTTNSCSFTTAFSTHLCFPKNPIDTQHVWNQDRCYQGGLPW